MKDEEQQKLHDMIAKKTKEIEKLGLINWEYNKGDGMDGKAEDWDDFNDFTEICANASDSYLVGLCEYEIKASKNAILEDDIKRHMQFADIAYKEMEKREIV